jgi:hypothetical protein
MFFFPRVLGWLSIIFLISSLAISFFFIFQKHVKPLKPGQLTRIKFTRNVLLDILGLLLTIAAASYLGGLAGMQLGTSCGLWIGLIAGMLVAFLAA